MCWLDLSCGFRFVFLNSAVQKLSSPNQLADADSFWCSGHRWKWKKMYVWFNSQLDSLWCSGHRLKWEKMYVSFNSINSLLHNYVFFKIWDKRRWKSTNNTVKIYLCVGAKVEAECEFCICCKQPIFWVYGWSIFKSRYALFYVGWT